MNKTLITAFDLARADLLADLQAITEPPDYLDLLRLTVTRLAEHIEYDAPDPSRVTMIDHGDYQGTLFFVVSASGHHPNEVYVTHVGYGSCSGCDTLEWVRDEPAAERPGHWMTLCLHMVQHMVSYPSEDSG